MSEVYVINSETGEILEYLGKIIGRNVNSIIEMYNADADFWCCKGFIAEIIVDIID